MFLENSLEIQENEAKGKALQIALQIALQMCKV